MKRAHPFQLEGAQLQAFDAAWALGGCAAAAEYMREIDVRTVWCPACHGLGLVAARSMGVESCPVCVGKGYIKAATPKKRKR